MDGFQKLKDLADECRQPKSMGFMYVAKRPCGRLSAASWDDVGSKKDIAAFVSRCIKRGDVVERIERFEGDPMPDFICQGCSKQCEVMP